ncbi:MAG TPA: LPS assembly protein LptD [Myxococcales bacterium]|nr:LPS assembly protein LptD [Myxococcales bacterium]
MIVAAILLALAQVPGGRVAVDADRLTSDAEAQVVTAGGHAVLRTDRAVLRADEITYDQATGRAVARGHVTLAVGLIAAVADGVDLDVETLEAELDGALLMQKRNVAPEALRDAATPEALKAAGETALALRGKRLRQLGPNHFEAEGLSFTPCDCRPDEPSWRIDAARADVELGERATLTWPVVSVHGIPVLPLPWAYLPLAERRTGLLVPSLQSSSPSGALLEQPLFITLGDSADATLSPGWFFGGSDPAQGARGPRLSAELRYAPSDHTSGRALLAALYDLQPLRDPVDPLRPAPAGRRGLRFEGAFRHDDDLGQGVRLRADLSAVSDGYYVRDLTSDVLVRSTQYLRSTAVLSGRADDRYAGLDVTLRQDTRYGYSLFQAGAPSTLQRLPALSAALLDRPLFGPVSFSATAEYARLAPLLSGTGDEGTDGDFNPANPDPDGSEADGRYQPGEREARDRLDLRARVAAPLRLGDALRMTPSLAYREDVYVGERTGRLAQRGYPVGGVTLDTQLSRTFAGVLRHTITPSVELRSVPVVLGAPPGLYDELDAAVPQAGLLQAVAEVDQRLLARDGARVVELARLDVGQGYDVLQRRLGDTFARAALRAGWLGADATARYSVPERRLAQLAAGASLDDGRGHRAFARYERLLSDGSDRQRRGADALVGPASTIPAPDLAEQLTAGASYRFPFGLTLSYDALVSANLLASATPLDSLTQQALTAGYSPSCDCWRIDLSLSLTHQTAGGPWRPGWGIHFNLARFGSFGS